jgi:murein DD-endopeptidase MepM/ murein hydrolase activator NlpD
LLLGAGAALACSCHLASSCAPRERVPLEREGKQAQGFYHVVKKDETLWRICYRYGVDLQEVAELNGIENPTQIKVGQRIFIPGAPDRVKEVAPEAPRQNAGAKGANPPPDAEPAIQRFAGKLMWPVDGVVYSKFGVRGGRHHDGIDIAAPKGTPILAAADGRVIFAAQEQRGYGKLIILEHSDQMHTVYAHNSRILVVEGQKVKRGQRIAEVGNTGEATGYHLHFEVRVDTKARNPLFFLP